MKRIITILLSVILSLTLSAQDRTPMDKIWEDIEKIISNRQDSKMKINHGDGVVRYVHNGMVGEEYLCTKDCGGNAFDDMTSEEIEAANERNRKKVFGRIFGTIRHHLDSLMAFSEESYHFESHHHDTDTITYSLCLKNRWSSESHPSLLGDGRVVTEEDNVNSKDSVRKYKADDRSMVYPDAVETVFFDFTASPKPCGKHVRGFGTLGYNKNVFLPNRQSYYFDKQSYLDVIMPLLKRKDVQSWNFKWTHSADYDLQSNWKKEFVGGDLVGDFEPKNAGQTVGTMYFIPRDKGEFAEAVFAAIDSVTLDYTDIHPEQMFRYSYRVKEEVMQYTESSHISTLFEGTTGKGNVSTRVLFGITSKGYYVAIANVENNFCIPKEWHVLKSFVNGRKEYIKEAKK